MKPKWTHAWNLATGKYMGFFSSEKDAKAWHKKQANKDEIEICDRAPERATSPEYDSVNQGLDAALAAVKGEKDDVEPA